MPRSRRFDGAFPRARGLLRVTQMRGVFVASVILVAGCYEVRGSHGGGAINRAQAKESKQAAASPFDIEVPNGYRVELFADKLTYPTGIAFGDKGRIFVVESGYSYGEDFGTGRLLELTGGTARELAKGDHVPWTGVAYHDNALYVAQGGEKDGGRIVRFDLDGDHVAKETVLVDNLPSLGDHHTNGPVVASDGWVYFGQGTATNSGVVGPDNQMFGWLTRHQDFHDTPCRDVTLNGVNFTSDNPLGQGKVTTGAYLPYGTPSERGQVIEGHVPCNGAVMRVKTTGGPVELVAWGFRNPFGLALDRGTLYVTDNGFDMRGSRPVFGAADVLWKVEMSHWYGWPDYSEGRPLTAGFYSEGGGKPGGFLLAQHPETPPQPTAYFPVHSSADGLDFSHGEAFGYPGWAFVALFGDMAPTAGKVLGPVGFDIMRVDPATGDLVEFARNRGDKPGPASQKHQRGFERPVAVRFDSTGAALYVVDFGVIRMTEHGAEPERESGRIWKIVREARYASDD